MNTMNTSARLKETEKWWYDKLISKSSVCISSVHENIDINNKLKKKLQSFEDFSLSTEYPQKFENYSYIIMLNSFITNHM